ncbi:MAG: decarboxylase [Pseudomonadota bacterium]
MNQIDAVTADTPAHERPGLSWAEADALAETHGAAFFILDDEVFKANFTALQNAFSDHYPDVRIGYSYKTNYTPHLCRIAYKLGGFAEVVSEMEYHLACKLGVEGPRIIFNGPYKAGEAFRDALLRGATVNLDSLRDIAMLQAVTAGYPDRDFPVVLRCNFALSDDQDTVSRFGMDVDGPEFAEALRIIGDSANTRLSGLHCHFPDRDLASFGRRAERMVALTQKLFPETPPETLNIGGGFFSNMPESLRQSFHVPPATFADYGALVGGILSKAFDGSTGKPPTLFLEPGTAVVADTQRFYTRVLGTKIIRGRPIATVAGSIFDISPTARSVNLPVEALNQHPGGEQHAWDIGGFTCIEGDIMTRGFTAALAQGDFLAYRNVGSYSVVMRPPFILPANPVLVPDGDGYKVVKERETNEDVFRLFKF